MREQKTQAQMEKKNQEQKLQNNTHPVSPLPQPVKNQPPPTYPIPPICNNNTMDTEFRGTNEAIW